MIVLLAVLSILLLIGQCLEGVARRLQGQLHDLKIYQLQREVADLRAQTGITYTDPDWDKP